MLEFQEKKKIRHIMYSWPVSVVIGVLTIVSFNAVYKMYKNTRETGINRNSALNEKAVISVKTKDLEKSLVELKTTRGIEEEIRKKFRVVKGEEGVIIVVDGKGDGNNVASTTQTDPKFEPLFDRIRKLFQ